LLQESMSGSRIDHSPQHRTVRERLKKQLVDGLQWLKFLVVQIRSGCNSFFVFFVSARSAFVAFGRLVSNVMVSGRSHTGDRRYG